MPHVSQHCVPYSCISTSSQTAPHRSHNKWCPTVVPHLHLHKLSVPHTSHNKTVYPTCLTKLCRPHMSHNKTVYPTCLTKLCIPHMSHNKTMCTPHVSQQNYVYPTCLTTKLCYTPHVSQRNYVYCTRLTRIWAPQWYLTHPGLTTPCVCVRSQTPRAAFKHLPPNSAITGYANEGTVFTSAHPSTDSRPPPRKT